MLTEKEAKEKICPMTMEHDLFESLGLPCVASKCMAWRWDYTWKTEWNKTGEREYTEREKPATRQQTEQGYCGLAGKE